MLLLLTLLLLCLPLVLDVCRKADGELLHSGASVCGFVLLRLHEWLSLRLVKVQMLPPSWHSSHTLIAQITMTKHNDLYGELSYIL